MAVRFDNIKLQDIDDTNYDEDGHYDQLVQISNEDVAKTNKEKDLLKILHSDKRWYKRVGGGVLLCAVLVLLSIAVPVYLYSASRLSATEAKMEELQTRLTESEKLVELQRIEADQQQTSFDQFQTRFDQFQDILNLLTNEQDCRKLCKQHGFTYADGLCYYISHEKKNWADSRQWCRDNHSDLIVIKSKEKQDLVASLNKRVWLGLTDREREGSFQWVDGTPLTTPTYWFPGEPHGETNEYPNAGQDCVEYYDGSVSGAPTRGWFDDRCSSLGYWMCERVVC